MTQTLCLALTDYATVATLAAAANALIGSAPAGHAGLVVTAVVSIQLARAADGRHLDALAVVAVEPRSDPEWDALDRALAAAPAPAPTPAAARPPTGDSALAAQHQEIARLMKVLNMKNGDATAFLSRWKVARISELDARGAASMLRVLQRKAAPVDPQVVRP